MLIDWRERGGSSDLGALSHTLVSHFQNFNVTTIVRMIARLSVGVVGSLLLILTVMVPTPCASRRAFYRRNSRQLRRLSRLYDWQLDENGLIPIEPASGSGGQRRSVHRQVCANDSYILETILSGYNRHKVPGGGVEVVVEVWVQEITTISDITSDFQVKFDCLLFSYENCYSWTSTSRKCGRIRRWNSRWWIHANSIYLSMGIRQRSD
jgi:hypothetical protein